MTYSPHHPSLRLMIGAAILLGTVACSGTNGVAGSPVPLAGSWSAAPTGSTATGPTARPTVTSSANSANARFRPAGFPVPKGATLTLPTADFHSELTMHIGDVFSTPPADWLPDNSDSSTLNGVLVLAAATSETLTYQAVKPGTITFTTGPVGHPAGCDQPGKSCADATPPPTVAITVTR